MSEQHRQLVAWWTERRTRKLHAAKMAATRGDYATAMKETAEADATLICMHDLYTVMEAELNPSPA